jgi:hypothetical protein
MKAVSVKELNNELSLRSSKEVRDLCLRLSRFRKENKELLTYLLFEASDEASYIESVKSSIDEQFAQINRKSYYLMKKSIRRILAQSRKYIRYSQNKQTEVELLIYFCRKLKSATPSIQNNQGLVNLYSRQIEYIIKKIALLHEDLQYDYNLELEKLSGGPSKGVPS